MKRWFAIVSLIASSAVAQERITISAIVVEGGRIPVRVITAETTLEEGREYPETAIRRAVDRVKRLPFVLDAAYQLEPADGGTYRLVIAVAATTSFSYGVDARSNLQSGDSGVGVLAGANLQSFLGSRSLIEGFVGESGGSGSSGIATLSAGYTAFDLFGVGARLSVTVSQTLDSDVDADVSPSLALFVPVTVSQSIRLTANRQFETFERSFFSGFNDGIRATGERERQAAGLHWLYQTTDDPFFSRSGWDVAAGPEWTTSRVINPVPLGGDQVRFDESETTQTIFSIYGAHFWPVAERWMTVARAGVASMQQERRGAFSRTSDSRSGNLEIGFGRNFGDARDLATGTRNRFELAAGSNFFDFESSSRIAQSEYALLSWTHRSRWGRVRVIGVYSFD